MSTVLHYTGYRDETGGIVTLLRALAAEMPGVCLHGTGPGGRGTVLLPALELQGLEPERVSPVNSWRARRVAREVQAWLQGDTARIFHGHSRAGLLVALWLDWWGERRVVVSVHCYGRQRWFYRWAARRLGPRLFWLSPAMRAYYGAPGSGWEQCISGGVAPASVALTATVPGRLRLGGIGALVPWKGWQLVLEAMALLPAEVRERVGFTHIGGGNEAERVRLEQRARELGLTGQVHFRGQEADSRRLLGEIDALVIASRNEPFSIAMMEALAAGVPVLAADTGGACDLIRDGSNGRFFRTGDADSLARLMGDCLRQPPVWDRERIRSSAVPIARVAAQWREIYTRLRQ